jgi:Rieske Fe-S protein
VRIDEPYLARRRFLCGMIGGGAAAMAAGATLPLARFAGNFHEEPPPEFIEIAKAECELAPGESKLLMYGPIPALLLKPADAGGELRMFVAVCTHLSCTVSYQKAQERIYCACHEGYYDTSGQVLSGPPPAPLRQLFYKIKGEKMIIAMEKENLEKAT